MSDNLTEVTRNHWQQLRGMTYDLLDKITQDDWGKKLPFASSQNLQYQFWCMLATQESWMPLLTTGVWGEFSCSLDKLDADQVSVARIRQHMQEADKQLLEVLGSRDLLRAFEDGSMPLMNYMILVEHESHHQGQLINFIYAHDLPIPESWRAKWALTRDE